VRAEIETFTSHSSLLYDREFNAAEHEQLTAPCDDGEYGFRTVLNSMSEVETVHFDDDDLSFETISSSTTWSMMKLVEIFDFDNQVWAKRFSAHPLYHLEQEAMLYELADIGPSELNADSTSSARRGADFTLLDNDTAGILLE
jgi:hypothetical protein